jgi:hypothetical protein
MSPSHTAKAAKRYRYYASRTDLDDSKEPVWRVPAGDLEQIVTARLGALLRSGSALHDAVAPFAPDAITTQALLFEAAELERRMGDMPASQQRATLLRIITRIEVHSEQLSISVDRAGLIALTGLEHSASAPAPPLALTVAVKLVRRAREVKLTIPPEPGRDVRQPDPALIKLIAKAYAARKALFDGSGRAMKEIAAEQGHESHYFSVLVKLAFLAPDIIAAILDGRQPPELTRQMLARFRDLPMDWKAQRTLLGFDGKI